MSLNIALLNAISALQINTRALDITAQNVSNVNTEGYSRKTVSQQSVSVGGQGAGVEIAGITRSTNKFLLAELRTSISQLSDNRVQDSFFTRMQDMFGSLTSNTSIGASINNLAVVFQAMSDTPEDVAARTELVERAKLLVQKFNDMATKIENYRLEVDQEIAASVTEVNNQLTQIQDLNLKIAENLTLNLGSTELEDQRDIALNKIADHLDFRTYERSNGEIVVFTSAGRMLVDRSAQLLSHSAVTAFDPSITYGAGTVQGITLGGTDITTEISAGRIAALIELRDRILPNLHAQIQELATTLHDEINLLHNQGTGYPGLPSMTGSRTMAGTDTPVWTGSVRITVLDASGVVVETQDINLAGLADIDALVAVVNGYTDASASITANGKVSFSTASTNRIAINEMTSAVTVGNRTMGLSAFLGLNDLFVSGNDYDDYRTAYQPSATTTLGLAGTVTFQGGFGTTDVDYIAGDSLTDIAATINGNATLIAQNITASIATDGSGFRLRITDSDGNNFFITDSSTLISTMDIKARGTAITSELAVRSDIVSDPSRVSRGQLASGVLAVGDFGLSVGDKSIVQSIANRFNAVIDFNATGKLAASKSTIAQYASQILALNATQANGSSGSLKSKEILFENLSARIGSISGVNLDEEMSRMIILENAYAAAARVITVTQTLFDLLIAMVR